MGFLGRILVFVGFLSLFLFTNTYTYADNPVKMRNMCISFASRHLSGDWYDANGNLVHLCLCNLRRLVYALYID